MLMLSKRLLAENVNSIVVICEYTKFNSFLLKIVPIETRIDSLISKQREIPMFYAFK